MYRSQQQIAQDSGITWFYSWMGNDSNKRRKKGRE